MSEAWETTTEDVQYVLKAHGIDVGDKRLDEIFRQLDHDAVEQGVLHYCEIDDQTASMFDDIENQLIEAGIIPAGTQKRFSSP